MTARAMPATQRQGGILLHVTSLPGPGGVGDLGRWAREWLQRLREAGLALWQMLPIHPPGGGDSPYDAVSSFAGNPLLISLEDLAAEGWIGAEEIAGAPGGDGGRAEFEALRPWKMERLRAAVARWRQRARPDEHLAYGRWLARAGRWVDDVALFLALRERNGNAPWWQWPRDVRLRKPRIVESLLRDLREEVETQRVIQFWFTRQWRRLRATARRTGVELIGDVPFFVAADSADVWAHRELFQLDSEGRPRVVAGVPPDYFSATGQLWGNPVYAWEQHRRTGFKWWIERLRHAAALFDHVRLDHFRGFEAVWEVPAGATTAVEGQWRPSPGAELLAAVRRRLGRLPIVAENLGVITDAVEGLRRRFRLPGMLVLQFAFERLLETPPAVPEACEPDTVIYTGTHDNDTAVGWFSAEPGQESTEGVERHRRLREAVARYLQTDGSDVHWRMIEVVWRSPANWAIVPMQDVLGLGREARMNVPGVGVGNWRWRMRTTELARANWSWLRDLCRQYVRTPPEGTTPQSAEAT
ncbi:MAG: 4-alpha-glucanotransferase [Kiritimatiellae bacterium]|nr:4-alpha-glucanotransferase [Kiritimatiellia bacterium]